MRLVKKYKEPDGPIQHPYDKQGAELLAFLRKLTPKTNSFPEPCATFTNRNARDNGYENVRGNAWNVQGVNVVENGFKNIERKEGQTKEDLNKRNHDAADSLMQYLDLTQLNPSTPYLVNMYHNNSNYTEQADREGNSYYGTHLGFLFTDENGNWTVTDKRDGTVDVRPINEVLGSQGEQGITAVLKPQYTGYSGLNKLLHWLGL